MKGFLKFVVVLFALFWLFSLLMEAFRQAEQAEVAAECTDYSEVDSVTFDRTHHRTWQLPGGSFSTFCSYYHSYEDLHRQSAAHRNVLDPQEIEYKDFWGTVYRELVRENNDKVIFLADSLSNVAMASQLDGNELAELVVSFVQDIPYHFVNSGECLDAETGGRPCVPNARFGILSPYEFIHTLSGDCDTRVVLLYSLLQTLGFDPIIVISYEYRHAMLALNTASSGDHLTLGGNNYYFWETTATGWPLGMLPPDMQNLNYWEIALANEL